MRKLLSSAQAGWINGLLLLASMALARSRNDTLQDGRLAGIELAVEALNCALGGLVEEVGAKLVYLGTGLGQTKGRLMLATFLPVGNLATDALQSEDFLEHNPEPDTECTQYPRVASMVRQQSRR